MHPCLRGVCGYFRNLPVSERSIFLYDQSHQSRNIHRGSNSLAALSDCPSGCLLSRLQALITCTASAAVAAAASTPIDDFDVCSCRLRLYLAMMLQGHLADIVINGRNFGRKTIPPSLIFFTLSYWAINTSSGGVISVRRHKIRLSKICKMCIAHNNVPGQS